MTWEYDADTNELVYVDNKTVVKISMPPREIENLKGVLDRIEMDRIRGGEA